MVSERVDERDPSLGDMPNIAGREGEVVLQRGRHELAVFDRDGWVKRHELSPPVATLRIKCKNARAVAQHEGCEPCLESGGILGARHPLFLEALPDLSERDDAQKQIG